MRQRALCIWEICRKCRDTHGTKHLFSYDSRTCTGFRQRNRAKGQTAVSSENKRVSPNLFALLFSPRLTKGNILTPMNYFSVFARSCCTKNPGASTVDSKTGFATFTLFSRLAVAPSFLHSTPPPSYPRVSAARLLLLTSQHQLHDLICKYCINSCGKKKTRCAWISPFFFPSACLCLCKAV